MKSKIIFFHYILALLFLYCNVLLAQYSNPAVFTNYSTKDGLSQNAVNTIVQDQTGFMWFGTNDGLNRFDGKAFKIYKYDNKNKKSIANNHIRSIVLDKNDGLWIGTAAGISYYNPVFDNFINIKLPATALNNKITSLFIDHFNRLLIVVDNRELYLLNLKLFHQYGMIDFSNMPIDFRVTGNIWVVHRSKLFATDDIWIGSDKGIFLLNQTSFELRDYYADKKIKLLKNQFAVYDILEHDSTLSVLKLSYYESPVSIFSAETKRFIPLKVNLGPIIEGKKLTISSSGEYWMTTWDSGLIRFSKDNKGEKKIEFMSKPFSELENVLISLYEDRSGNIWSGGFNGVIKYSPASERFKYIIHPVIKNNGIYPNSVRAIYEDEHNIIWHGGYSNLFQYDPKTNKNTAAKNIADDFVRVIYEDPIEPNIVWLGMEGSGLLRYNKGNGSVSSFYPAELVTSILRDSYGNLWIGTFKGGLKLFDEDENQFITKIHSKKTGSISDNNVTTILQDKLKRLWIGTASGLNLYNYNNSTFQSFKHNPEDSLSLSNDDIKAIHQSANGEIWIATSDGLNRLNEKPGGTFSFISYSTPNGFADNVIYGILEDTMARLWLSTNNGITLFNPENMDVHNFNNKDGLQDNEFNTGAFYKCKHGNFFFGGIKGITYFNPNTLILNPYPATVQFTSYKIFNKTVQIDSSIVYKKSIELEYDENIISFNIAALEFTTPDKNQYAYKLEGFNSDWIFNGNKNEITFTNLDPGNYTLYVKAANNDGIWSEEEASLNIIVHPPYWQTWWFITLVSLLILAIFYIIHRVRMFDIQKQKLELQKEIDQRKKAELVLAERLKFENIIATFSNQLIKQPIDKIDIEIQNSLSVIAKFAKVNRCFIISISDDFKIARLAFEWKPAGVPSLNIGSEEETANYPFLSNLLKEGKSLIISSIEELPSEAVAGRKFMLARSIAALAILPMVAEGNLIGLIGIDAVAVKNWTDLEINLLRHSAEIFANALVRKRKNIALQESEEKFSKAFHSSPDLVGISTIPEGRFIDINDAAETISGFTREEIIGKTGSELNIWANSKDREYYYNEMISKGKISGFEAAMYTKNRDLRTCLLTSEIVQIANRPCAIFILRDITEFKKAQQALVESEQNYRAVVEDQTEFIVRWKPDGTCNFVNKAFCEYFKQPYHKFIDANLFHFLSKKEQAYVKKMLKYITYENPILKYQHKSINNDGDVTWQQWLTRGIFDSNKNLVEIQSIGRDITEQKISEDVIKENERRYHVLFEESPVALWEEDFSGILQYVKKLEENGVTDIKKYFSDFPDAMTEMVNSSIIIDVNRAAENLYQAKNKNELIKKLNCTFSETTLAFLVSALISIVENKQDLQIEIPRQTFKGKNLDILQEYAIVPGYEKTLSRVFIASIDISERKKAVKDLERSRGQLRSLTSHLQKVREEERNSIAREMHDELGQILTALKMDIIVMEKEISRSEKGIEPKAILDETDHMKKLIDSTINNVRKLIRELRPEVLDNLGLMSALKWQSEEFTEKSGIIVNLKTTIDEIDLDQEHNIAIFRMFQESLTNIARHAQATRVDVTIEQLDDKFNLSIKDNGIGIPQTKLHNLQTFGILGIQERAYLLGGDVNIDSKENKGTKVTLSIPFKAGKLVAENN